MAGFDQQAVFTSMSRDNDEMEENDEDQIPVDTLVFKNAFRAFLREFQEGQFNYKYRDALKKNYNSGQYWLEVLVDDFMAFNDDIGVHLRKRPTEFLALFEEAAKELVDELTAPRQPGYEIVQDIQIMLLSNAVPIPIRNLSSNDISKLVKVSGIVLTTSGVRSKTVRISLMCRGCRSILPNITIKPGLEGLALPRKCVANAGPNASDVKCPLDPYFIMPDKCNCIDFQTLKMQEAPETVPSGDMPRHIQIFCDRYLCEKAVPGNRITVYGIYSIKKAAQQMKKSAQSKVSAGVRIPYIRVLGIDLDSNSSGRTGHIQYTPEEETQFRNFANDPECYQKIASSIAPSIFGSEDIKKTIACMLFGGSRKRLPDGLARRGDINVLLLGDPGTAKSQLLKFVEKVSPIAIYTSGKGSSAAGLTASINRDPATRNFVMEGGAMVLADGGVVCIDEFDKMREDDRVAIHEAMEQQTISIAKAGITTTLNSRCAVLAAANSIFGRWDDTKGDENIDFMPTIISRFDAIFIVKDEHNESRDTTLAKHVMTVHMNAQGTGNINETGGELSLNFLKKYIAFCKANCGPRLSETAATKLLNRYILMRSGEKDHEDESDKKGKIVITVRQLEAIVRMAESLAKMQLKPFATEVHVDEALRLFQVSTLDAASNGNLAGADGFTTAEDQEILSRIETQLKRRLAIGALVSEQTIIQDFLRQKYQERSITRVVTAMIRRGELQHRHQRKMLLRIK